MKIPKNFEEQYPLHQRGIVLDVLKRLESVQGPEQGLVGEARSDSETGHAEEAKPGERGVGEIGGASELLRHIDREIKQAQVAMVTNEANGRTYYSTYNHGKWTALAELRKHIEDTAEKRSDLSNARAMTPAKD